MGRAVSRPESHARGRAGSKSRPGVKGCWIPGFCSRAGRLELVFKGAGIAFQDGRPGLFNGGRMRRRVVAVGAPAFGAAGGAQGKTLAIQLEALGFLAGARTIVVLQGLAVFG